MNRYEAFYAAADQIERHPELYDFNTVKFPGCGTPGCALGWVAYFSELKQTSTGSWSSKDVMPFIKTSTSICFYDWMYESSGKGWIQDAAICAKGLRLFADTHFADEAPPSDEVRALLNRASRRVMETEQ